jgi:HK97 family phage portal protein
MGSSYIGGPSATDAWGSKRAPSPTELVESFKSIAYSCAVRNADAVSAVPLKLYMDSSNGRKPKDFSDPRDVSLSTFRHLQRSGAISDNGTKVADIKEIRNHPFLNTLDNPDPNGDFDRTSLLKHICLSGDIIGSAYIYPEGPEGRPYTALWPLYSQYVLPIRSSNNPVVSQYQYFANVIGRDRMIRFGHSVSLKDPYGTHYPPLYAAIEYARLEDKFVTVQEQLLAMGPRPNMIATPKDANNPLGEHEKDRFQQDLDRKHARGAQGGILVTTAPLDFKPITYTPADLSGLQIAEYDWQAVCGAFGVPFEFFTTDTNLANQQAAREKHAEHAVRPRCTSIAARLNWIVRRWDRRLFFAFDDPNRLDELQRATIIDMEIKNGTRTINQANEETGRPPVPWGDQPWLENTRAQPDMIQKLNEATITASTLAASGSNEGGGTAAVGNKDAKKPRGGKPSGKKRGGDGRDDRGGGGAGRRVDRGVHDEGDEAVHGVEGLGEDEDRDPFDWLSWSVDPPSAAGG